MPLGFGQHQSLAQGCPERWHDPWGELSSRVAPAGLVSSSAAPPENGEWAIRHKPARKALAPMSGIEAPGYSEMHYFLIIQRKPLFYVINIISPCVLISSLVVLVYFLPSEGESLLLWGRQAGGEEGSLALACLSQGSTS